MMTSCCRTTFLAKEKMPWKILLQTNPMLLYLLAEMGPGTMFPLTQANKIISNSLAAFSVIEVSQKQPWRIDYEPVKDAVSKTYNVARDRNLEVIECLTQLPGIISGGMILCHRHHRGRCRIHNQLLRVHL